ncbi:hypothetical protein D3C76_1440890 [compost metagenome]
MIPIRIPLRPVWTGIHRLVPIATPARSLVPNLPDILVSKKVMADKAIWVIRIGKRICKNCPAFCLREYVCFMD